MWLLTLGTAVLGAVVRTAWGCCVVVGVGPTDQPTDGVAAEIGSPRRRISTCITECCARPVRSVTAERVLRSRHRERDAQHHARVGERSQSAAVVAWTASNNGIRDDGDEGREQEPNGVELCRCREEERDRTRCRDGGRADQLGKRGAPCLRAGVHLTRPGAPTDGTQTSGRAPARWSCPRRCRARRGDGDHHDRAVRSVRRGDTQTTYRAIVNPSLRCSFCRRLGRDPRQQQGRDDSSCPILSYGAQPRSNSAPEGSGVQSLRWPH